MEDKLQGRLSLNLKKIEVQSHHVGVVWPGGMLFLILASFHGLAAALCKWQIFELLDGSVSGLRAERVI